MGVLLLLAEELLGVVQPPPLAFIGRAVAVAVTLGSVAIRLGSLATGAARRLPLTEGDGEGLLYGDMEA